MLIVSAFFVVSWAKVFLSFSNFSTGGVYPSASGGSTAAAIGAGPFYTGVGMSDRTPPARAARVLIVVVAAAVAAAVLVSDLQAVGSFLFPLDDSYIYLQYAVRAAQGHPFSYGPGEPPSTGATSLLYLALLVVPAFAGLRGDALAVAAFVLGAGFLAGSGLLVHRLVGRTFRPSVALASALLLVVTGPCLWGILSGMEIGMAVFLFLLAAETLAKEMEDGRLRRAPLLLALLCFARPEAVPFAAAPAGWTFAAARRSGTSGRGRLALVALAPAALVLLDLALTGRPGPDTARPKSPLYTPTYSPVFHAENAGRFLASVGEGLVTGSFVPRGAPGFRPEMALAFLPPLALVLFAAALAYGLPAELRARRPGPCLLLGGWFVSGTLAVAFLSGGSGHHFRYLLPALAGLVALLPPGVDALLARLEASAPRTRRGAAFGLASALLLLWQFRTAVDFIERYGREARGLAEYREAADWMRASLPPGDRVAILDAGIVGYRSARRLVDLYGLTTAAMAPSTPFWADWAGSKYEVMAGWPPAERPRWFLAHRIRFDEHGDDAHLAPFRGRAVKTFPSPPPGVPAIGRDLTLWEIDWNRLRPAPLPCRDGAGGPVVDSLNVADVASERAHAWRAEMGRPDSFPSNRVAVLGCGTGEPAADGVRGNDRAASFTLRAPDGGPARLALRVTGPPGTLRVEVNGAPAGDALLDGNAREWREPVLSLPPGALRAGDNRVRVSGVFLVGRAWLLAGAPPASR